jgi:hypothetical protein
MKTVEESKPESQGIKRLWLELQQARKDGKKLFKLILQEKATPEAIHRLASQASLSELILFTLDHRKDVTTSFSRVKSNEARAKKTKNDLDLVFRWCNDNPELARLPFHTSVKKAVVATKIQQHTTVRNNISLWRKTNIKK